MTLNREKYTRSECVSLLQISTEPLIEEGETIETTEEIDGENVIGEEFEVIQTEEALSEEVRL